MYAYKVAVTTILVVIMAFIVPTARTMKTTTQKYIYFALVASYAAAIGAIWCK